tara:strand:+ start:4342 stop:4719 length:378 start_codon:yes stop_codon:yes gene_type:complete
MKWETIEDFEAHHHSIIREICGILCDHEVIGDMSCELWSRVRKYAKRAYYNLCMDCCYAMLSMAGIGVSLTEMDAVALAVIKRPTATWNGRYGSWWEDPRGKEAILDICGGKEEDIMPLYQELCR